MNNYKKIKQMTVEKMAEWVRLECLHSHFNGIVLDVNSIKKWLLQEVKNEEEI